MQKKGLTKYIAIALIVLSGIANAGMDVLHSRFDRSVFNRAGWEKFWGPDSWKNKYRNGDPEQGASFPGSTTFLVFLTDGWHLLKAFMLVFIMLAIVFYKPLTQWLLVDAGIFLLIFTLTFEVFFSRVLVVS